MLTINEMQMICDRHTVPGEVFPSVVDVQAVQEELEFNWAFNELQVDLAVRKMRILGMFD